MDWNKLLYPENEQPLDRLVEGYSRTSIFRTIAFIGLQLRGKEGIQTVLSGQKRYQELWWNPLNFPYVHSSMKIGSPYFEVHMGKYECPMFLS